MKRKIQCLFCCTVLAMLPLGCSKSNDREVAQPGSTASVDGPVLSAPEAIAQARCSREERCDNIGVDAKYDSFAACDQQIRNDWQEDLDRRECPSGVDQVELDECLTEIRNEDCGNPFDSLERMVACSSAQICAD